MPDDVSTGELDRRLRDHEARTDRIHGEQDSRMARMAAEWVPLDLWQQAERARDAEAQRLKQEHADDMTRLKEDVIKPLRDDVAALQQGRRMTFGRWIALATVVTGFLTVIVAAWAVTKGAS